MTAAAAALMALLHRQRTGEGQFIELDQTENVATFLGEAFADYTMNGRVPTTLGNRHPTMAPHGAYPCAGDDEWLAVSVSTDAEWRGLCTAMDRDDLIGDPRFSTVLARWKHQDEMDAEIAAWTRTIGHVEAMRRLQAAGVPAGAVMDEPNLYADEHLDARGFFEALRHADAGEHRYPGLMWKSAAYPNRFRSPPCRLGEHKRLRLRRAPRPKRRRDRSPRSHRPHRHRIRPRARPTLTGPGRLHSRRGAPCGRPPLRPFPLWGKLKEGTRRRRVGGAGRGVLPLLPTGED